MESTTLNPIEWKDNSTANIVEPNKGGRPTSYKGEETIKACKEYLESCVDEPYERIKSDGKTSTSYDNLIRVKIPTIEGLAIHLEVSRDTIYEWKKIYPEFSDIIERLQSIQAERLLNNGLSGTYNSTIAKVLLTKHGYVDRQDTDITTNGKDINVSVLDRTASNEALNEFLNEQDKNNS